MAKKAPKKTAKKAAKKAAPATPKAGAKKVAKKATAKGKSASKKKAGKKGTTDGKSAPPPSRSMSGNTAERSNERPPQEQDRQPGLQHEMDPVPIALPDDWTSAGRFTDKTLLVTGGDSGIGRSVAVAFAREGANVACLYLDEDSDAEATRELVEAEGRECLLLRGDAGDRAFCDEAVAKTIDRFGRLDTLVNNAAEQHPQDSITDISDEQLERTFRTNIFAYFFLTRAALPYLKEHDGSTIVNTCSVVAFRGHKQLLDYSSTKGAIVAFTRSLSLQLAGDGIRVNSVAPGPIWTPLIPATFPEEKVESFGSGTPLGRAGQPWECAGAYVFLASRESTYITGQTIHINGGEVVGG